MSDRRQSEDLNKDNVSTMVLTPAMALEHIQPFFEHEWVKCRADDVKVAVVKGGYCSSIWLVSRANVSQNDVEPESVIVKKKGGNMFNLDEFDFTNDRLIALVAYEMATRGLGPKIYGIFPGGSIEEYIPSHTLTYDEVTDPEISKDIAIAMARSHAIQGLPFRKNYFTSMLDEVTTDEAMIKSKKEEIANFEGSKKHNWKIQDFVSFDVVKEKDWIFDFVKKGKFRQNMVLFDMNYLNVLVRDNPEPGQSRVMQIDYDIACYNLRGLDIGVHFMSRRFRWNATKKIIPNSNELSEDQKRKFLEHYQQEIKRLNLWPNFDENGIDSVDNLLLESKVGQLFSNLLSISYIMIEFEKVGDFFADTVNFFFDNYLRLKAEITNNNI